MRTFILKCKIWYLGKRYRRDRPEMSNLYSVSENGLQWSAEGSFKGYKVLGMHLDDEMNTTIYLHK